MYYSFPPNSKTDTRQSFWWVDSYCTFTWRFSHKASWCKPVVLEPFGWLAWRLCPPSLRFCGDRSVVLVLPGVFSTVSGAMPDLGHDSLLPCYSTEVQLLQVRQSSNHIPPTHTHRGVLITGCLSRYTNFTCFLFFYHKAPGLNTYIHCKLVVI